MAKKAYTKSELKKFEKNILEKIGEINESIEGVRSTTQPNNSVFIEERSEDFNEGTEAHELVHLYLMSSLMSLLYNYCLSLKIQLID